MRPCGELVVAGASPKRGPRFGGSTDLPLGELLAASRFAKSDLLALDLARIARHESRAGKRRFECFVVIDQRTGDAMAHCARLPRLPTTRHVHLNVKRARVVGQCKRLPGNHSASLALKVIIDGTTVDDDRPRTALQEDACHRTLAAAGPIVIVADHVFTSCDSSGASGLDF